MEQGIGLGVLAQGVVDGLVGGVAAVGVGQVLVFRSEASTLTTVFALQPEVETISGLPGELRIGQVFRRVG